MAYTMESADSRCSSFTYFKHLAA